MLTQSVRTVWIDNMEYIEKIYIFSPEKNTWLHAQSLMYLKDINKTLIVGLRY